jgi:hypothetical protein
MRRLIHPIIFAMVVMCVLLLTSQNRLSQDNANTSLFTSGMVNGRYWQSLSHEEKLS